MLLKSGMIELFTSVEVYSEDGLRMAGHSLGTVKEIAQKLFKSPWTQNCLSLKWIYSEVPEIALHCLHWIDPACSLVRFPGRQSSLRGYDSFTQKIILKGLFVDGTGKDCSAYLWCRSCLKQISLI